MRRAKVVLLTRRNLPKYLDELGRHQPTNWPKLLAHAFSIVSFDLGQPEVAKTAVLEAVAAAHQCAVAITSRAQENAETDARENVARALMRISNCIKRLPAETRRAFNERAKEAFQDGHFDLDAFSDLVNALAECAKRFDNVEDARRILAAIGLVERAEEEEGQRTAGLLLEYEAIDARDKSKIECDLQAFIAGKPDLSSEQVLRAMADAFDALKRSEIQSSSHDLLVEYVTNVGCIWQELGLKPTRQQKETDPGHHSPFHRFVELVLLDHLNPRSRLFAPFSSEEKKALEKEFARIAERLEKEPFIDLKDIRTIPLLEWLITDDHVKQAQRALVQKTEFKAP